MVVVDLRLGRSANEGDGGCAKYEGGVAEARDHAASPNEDVLGGDSDAA
jgi:hypothetical protein